MRLGSCMPREAWRLPSPQPLQKNSADAKATFADNDDVAPQQVSHSSVCYSAVVKVKGINLMKEEFLAGPTMGGRPYGAPKSTSSSGPRPQRRRRHLRTTTTSTRLQAR